MVYSMHSGMPNYLLTRLARLKMNKNILMGWRTIGKTFIVIIIIAAFLLTFLFNGNDLTGKRI